MAKKTANGKNGSPLGFEAQLWAAADALRNNMDAAEYKHHIGPNPVGAKNFSPLRQPPNGTSKTIGSIVRGFKIGVTKWMRQNMPVQTVWQRNYYEHVIRNEDSLDRIRLYVVENPARWAYDRENPEAASAETKEKWAV